jgi:hypothetical protein
VALHCFNLRVHEVLVDGVPAQVRRQHARSALQRVHDRTGSAESTAYGGGSSS